MFFTDKIFLGPRCCSSCSFFFLNNYLFYLFWLCQVLLAARGIFEACGVFLVAACGLLVAACMQDLVPRPRIEPRPPALRARSVTHWTTREVPLLLLLNCTVLHAWGGGRVSYPCILQTQCALHFCFLFIYVIHNISWRLRNWLVLRFWNCLFGFFISIYCRRY